MTSSKRMNRLKTVGTALLLSSLPFAAHACNTEPYIGTICTFAFDWCPRGYVPADGRTLAIREYTALFGLLGFRYGGDNQNVFAIPDLRGRSVIAVGQGTGLPAITLGQKVGEASTTLTTAQTPLPNHTHTATFGTTASGSMLSIPATGGSLSVKAALQVVPTVGNLTGNTVALGVNQTGYLAGISGGTSSDPVSFKGPYTTATPPTNAGTLPAQVQVSGTAPTAAVSVPLPNITVADATAAAGTPVPTQSPAMGMTTCIAAQGLYPNRP